MFPIPRAKIGGPSVAAQYGDDDVSDRGLDDISLREDDLHSVNLGSEAIPGSRPAWISMLEKTDFQKLHLDPFAKKGGQSVKSSMYGTKASTFSPMYDARHMFQTHASLASYSVDGDLKQPWDSSSISAKHRGRNTILIVLGASALLFLVAAITAGALYAVVEDAQSSPVANRSQGEEGAVFSSTTPNIEMNTSSTEITTTPEPTTTEQPATTEPPTTTPKPTSTASPTTTLPPITTRTSPTPPPPSSPTTTLPPTTRTSPPPSPTTTVEVTLPPPTTQEPTTVAPTTTVTTTPMPTTTTTTTTVEETSTKMTTTSPTTTTPAPTTTPEPQYIFITVGRGLLHTPTSITCLWTRDQDYGVIVLEAVATDLDVQTTMVAFKDDGQHGSFYPELFESSVRERPEGHLLTTTIKNTSCADGSSNLLYRCSVKDNPQQRDDSPLFLEVPADVSMTSLPPRYVLENTQTTLTCQATVESGGDVSLTRRGQTGSGFVRMPSLSSDANILIEGGCYIVVSRTFIVTMEMALNGSHLRCESEKPQGSSGEYLILVIPESICTASSSQKVPHPYEPSLYVECSDLEPRLTVRTCSPSFVFDEKELKCVDPYVASVTFISGNFLEGSDLELVCSMTKGNYSNVKLLKTDVASSREILLVTFTSDGRDLVEAAFSRAATASREILPAPVTGLEFKLTLGGAVCSDDGEYFCRHDNGQTSSGLVDIKIPASPMEITLSDDIIEAQPAKATCTGTIDDMGAIILSSFDDAADSFVETSLFTQTSTQVNSGDVCKSSVTSQFSATLTFSRNGTKTRCETTSPVSTSSTREIVILPVSVCDQKSPGSVVAHPYNTVKYVTCGTPITVELCEAGLVWRQELEKCVDPGAAEVTILDASANEGERLEITCSLTPGSYAVIGVYRRAGDTEQPMVDFYRNGTDAILSQRVTSTVRRLVGSATHMVTSLDQVSCAVAGLYVCRHDNEQEDSGEVTVFALPSSSSEVLVSTVQVGGTQGTVRCSSIVVDKANNGRVILETAALADGPFTSSELDPPSSVTKSEDQCEITADLDFTIPNLDFATWNGTYVRCRTDFPTMTTQPVMMLLIDPSVCSQAPDGTTLGNPYQPDGYLECTGNLPQLRFCQDGKLWRQDLRNCALMTDATVSMSDTPRARVGDAVNITCQVTSGTFETVRLYQDKDGSKVPLVTFLPDGTSTKESQRISEVYRERNQDGGESMTSQLEVVSCDDEGVFWCEHDNTQSGQGYLDVDVPPLVTLTPDADFTPITKNTIICVANIDLRRSGVNIELKRRDPVSGDFVDAGVTAVDTAVLEERPGCFRRERTRFSQVFDLSWNNTDFRCDVAAPESSSSVSNVLVIPGDICVNEPIASLLAHPYTEFRYIMCFLDQYAVMPCPGEGYVYIPDVQECVLHGQTVAAIKAPTTFTDLEDLSLECLITSGNFQNVKLLKADGTTNTPLATLNSDLTTEVLESRDIQVDASFVDSFNVRHFRVTVKAASCGDDGQYICSLNDDQERAAIVDIVVPASPPSLSLPEDMISNLENNITCGSREAPSAQVTLQLQRFDPAKNLWQDSQIASVHTRLQDGLVGESRCRSKSEFEGVYDLTWNNTQLRCALKDTDLASDPQTLYIISEDHCTAYPMASTQTHPYNRNKYFYCFGQDISIFSCPDESLVWSQNLQNCVDPSDPDIAKSTIVRESVETTRNVAPVSSIQPETTTNPTTTVRPDPEITVNGGNLTLGSAASVSCDISYPMRGSVIMVLISDTGFDVMATFDMDTADGSKDTTTKNGLTLSRSQEGQVTTLTLTFRAFACSQAGVYVCSDDGGHTGSATVKAVVADQQLVFLPPSSMTPSEAVSFQCSGVVDKTGRLYFAVKGQDDPDTEFKELDLPGIEHQALELDSCTSVKSILVTSTFDFSYQGRHIRCEANTQEQGSESFQITFS